VFFRVSNLSKYYEFPLSFSKHALVKDNCISKQKYYKKYNYQNQPKLLPVKEQKNEKLVFQPPKNYCNCDDFVCRIQHLQKNIYYTNYYHETAKTTQPDKKKACRRTPVMKKD